MSIPRFNTRAIFYRSLTALALATVGFSTSAVAGTYTEAGDAGQLIGSAQTTVGTGALTDIFGSTADKFDVDLYLINITDFAAFSASTVNSGTDAVLDTQLFLLTTSGKAVCLNDNALGGFQSVLSGASCGTGLGNGQYLLGIGTGYYEPVDGNNVLLFAPGLDTAVRGPNSSFALAGYADVGAFDNAGAYDIKLTGAAAVSAVPEPATVALMLGGLAVCGVAARRQRASTTTAV